MNYLEQLWARVQSSALAQAIDGDNVELILAALGLLALWLLRGPLARLLCAFPSRLLGRADGISNDEAKKILDGPLRLAVLGAGLMVSSVYLSLEGKPQELVNRVALTLLVVALFGLLLSLLPMLRSKWTPLEQTFGSELIDWLAKGLRVATLLVGAATVLQLWGIQVAPIIAGAGLFGVAVALGAQTFFKNLIGGMLILAGKKFYKGEWIEVPGVIEGTVESIGFHSTVVRRFDKAPVTLPNTMLSDAAVVNYSRRPYRRISWTVAVVYQTTVPQLALIRDRIEKYINDNDDFVDPPQASVLVRVDKFSDSSIDFIVYCFTHTADWAEWLKIKEMLAYEIMRIVDEAGSAFAYPSQTLYLQDMQPSPEQAEA